MKMKKLGALLLAGVMTMSTLLTGCGNGASGSSAGGNASQTESGSNGERKKITILMRASETSAKYIIMKKLLTDFSEEKGLEPPEFELISGDADYVTNYSCTLTVIHCRIFMDVRMVHCQQQLKISAVL